MIKTIKQVASHYGSLPFEQTTCRSIVVNSNDRMLSSWSVVFLLVLMLFYLFFVQLFIEYIVTQCMGVYYRFTENSYTRVNSWRAYSMIMLIICYERFIFIFLVFFSVCQNVKQCSISMEKLVDYLHLCSWPSKVSSVNCVEWYVENFVFGAQDKHVVVL